MKIVSCYWTVEYRIGIITNFKKVVKNFDKENLTEAVSPTVETVGYGRISIIAYGFNRGGLKK